jgi:hypothetical protein
MYRIAALLNTRLPQPLPHASLAAGSGTIKTSAATKTDPTRLPRTTPLRLVIRLPLVTLPPLLPKAATTATLKTFIGILRNAVSLTVDRRTLPRLLLVKIVLILGTGMSET